MLLSLKARAMLSHILKQLNECGENALVEVLFQFGLAHCCLAEVQQLLADGMGHRPCPDEEDIV